MDPSSSSSYSASPLSESLVEEAFHTLLQDALIQAQAEGLLTNEEIARVDADIKIIASSLALYFAALQAQGSPPAIPFANRKELQLSQDNCPASFVSYFQLWQMNVSKVQRMNLDMRHDLALLLCEKEPRSSPIRMEVVSLARDLKAVALDIVQRSTFQSRFHADVQTAIDSSLRTPFGGHSPYIAPPNDVPQPLSLKASAQAVANPLTTTIPSPLKSENRRHSYRPLPPPPLPTIAIEPPEEETTTLMLIRETLFAALGDCLATNQDLLSLVGKREDKSWSSRCFFASLCLAILDVCLFRVILPPSTDMNHMTSGIQRQAFPWNDAFVKTVHDTKGHDKVSLDTCPQELNKLLLVLFQIGMFVQGLSESDDRRAMQDAADDQETKEEELYIYRLKRKLLGDVSASTSLAERHGEDYVKDAAVMINRLALSMFEIPSFRQRQTEAFVILGAITSV